MSVYLICNVGNRDLVLNNNLIEKSFIEGEKIFNDYKRYQNGLDIPIIKPVVEYIKRKHNKIEKILLFVTDQECAEERFKQQDTIYFGKIIQKILANRYSCNAKVIKITRNPSLYDEMLKFYKQKLSSLLKEYDTVYISPVGGTPACSFALIFNGIKIFKDKCNVIYVPEKSKGTEVIIPLSISEQILNEFRNVIIEQELNRYNYAGVVAVLEKMEDKDVLHKLALYALHRLYFDFDRALDIIESIVGITQGEDRNFFINLSETTRKLLDTKKLTSELIRELYFNAKIKLVREEYVDFLGRIFRFIESVMRYIVEKEIKLHTDISIKNGKKLYMETLENTHGLKDYLENKKVNGNKLEYAEPNIQVLKAIIEFIIQKKMKNEYESLLNKIEKFISLSSLRNKSIIAHGFEGVSKEKLEKSYGNDIKAIQQDMLEILKSIGINLTSSSNDFTEINNFIIGKLKL